MGKVDVLCPMIRVCLSFLSHLDEPSLTKNVFACFSPDRTESMKYIFMQWSH